MPLKLLVYISIHLIGTVLKLSFKVTDYKLELFVDEVAQMKEFSGWWEIFIEGSTKEMAFN